ncbi:DUF1453 domain-containing protein [Dyella tabacisoli]|uniref:DUF1453 domain-containing protein n=1 Tax=Dyella tabacisoli TaxID=2282381 RepID=A0A369UNY8_9GAMM|nr:DUF1453 domain-containing protein [Dyella tabacisoli]RDD82251.1 DUF1453 domain-containing protein [Dyella tabacisoli]
MTPHLLVPAMMIPLMAFAIWRRVRSHFGPQPIRRKRMIARIVILSVLGGLSGLAGLQDIRLLEGLLGGVLAGSVLGFAGVRLTRFERDANGADAYIPNPWIGGALTVLLVSRLAWRFLVTLPQMQDSAAASSAPPFGNSPLTLLVFGLMIGYYVVYYAGLMIHHRRFERAQLLPDAT